MLWQAAKDCSRARRPPPRWCRVLPQMLASSGEVKAIALGSAAWKLTGCEQNKMPAVPPSPQNTTVHEVLSLPLAEH